MVVNEGEYLYAGVTNAAIWGIPAGRFMLKMSFDNPTTKQTALTCLICAAGFALIGSTTHYALSYIYQNQPDNQTTPPLLHRVLRVITSTLTTPLIAASLFTLCTQTTRTVRLQTLHSLKQCIAPKPLSILAISSLVMHVLYSTIYSSGSKTTPILSKKTFARLSTSTFFCSSAVFFATCFGAI